MALFGGRGKALIGLDIGASSIKIISGVSKKNAFLVDRLVIVPLPFRSIDERGIVNADVVAQAVATAISEMGIKAPLVATSAHGGSVLTKRVTIPKIPQKEIPDQVRWEAEQVFPQDITSILVSHVLLGEGNNVPGAPAGTPGWDLMLIGMRLEEATTLTSIVENSGAKLQYLDLDAFVVSDLLNEVADMPKADAVGFVDIGASATRVSVRHKNNVVFMREFIIGGNAFTEAIASALGLSFENAEVLKIQEDSGIPNEAMEALQGTFVQWKSELQQCEDIFVTQTASALVSRWYIFGGGARTPGLLDTLRDERFSNKVMPLPAEKIFRAKGKNVDSTLLAAWSGRLITAAGLSCRKG